VVVRILLVKDALNIELKPKVFCVIKRGDHYAKGQLLGIKGEIVRFLESGLLGTVEILDLLEIPLFQKGIEHVSSLH
jgi:hypothetical protein